jgi:large subunit ribosomal protein L9
VKLVLYSDVKALGKRGDVVDVAGGYARNFLLPRKLAGEADKGALAQLDSQQKAHQRREASELAEARANAAHLESAELTVTAKAGENGKLFGAVTNADIAAAIAAATALSVDKHKIELERQIKSLGTYPVQVKLHKNVVAKAVVNVVSE